MYSSAIEIHQLDHQKVSAVISIHNAVIAAKNVMNSGPSTQFQQHTKYLAQLDFSLSKFWQFMSFSLFLRFLQLVIHRIMN